MAWSDKDATEAFQHVRDRATEAFDHMLAAARPVLQHGSKEEACDINGGVELTALTLILLFTEITKTCRQQRHTKTTNEDMRPITKTIIILCNVF